MSKNQTTSMSKEAASRIQSAGDRIASSTTKQTGFTERAQSAADRQASQSKGGQQ